MFTIELSSYLLEIPKDAYATLKSIVNCCQKECTLGRFNVLWAVQSHKLEFSFCVFWSYLGGIKKMKRVVRIINFYSLHASFYKSCSPSDLLRLNSNLPV